LIDRKLTKALTRLAPPELDMSEISFKDLPLYSYDSDADFPPVAKAFKQVTALAMPFFTSRQSTTARFPAA
jgi:chromate reductase